MPADSNCTSRSARSAWGNAASAAGCRHWHRAHQRSGKNRPSRPGPGQRYLDPDRERRPAHARPRPLSADCGVARPAPDQCRSDLAVCRPVVQPAPLVGRQVGIGEVVEAIEVIGGQDLHEFLGVDEEVALQRVAVLAVVGQLGRGWGRDPSAAARSRRSACRSCSFRPVRSGGAVPACPELRLMPVQQPRR